MNRRSFFKSVTGFVAGAVGISAKAKPETKTLICKGKGGTLCPRCKFNYPATTMDTSSNNVAYEVKLTYWDKDEPDIYTFTDGIDVRAFGVKFGEDDTKAIQEALDSVKDGGIVYFPKGTYNIKYAINIKDCQLKGT